MCFSTDVIHSGHIAIIKKAAALGKLVVGVLSDEAVASYKRYPLISFDERKALIANTNYPSYYVNKNEVYVYNHESNTLEVIENV